MQLCRIFCNKKTKSTKDKISANDYEFTPIIVNTDKENESSEVVDDVGDPEMSSSRALVLPSFMSAAAPEF